MAAYIAIFLSLICIVLLAAILIKFKRLFSTEAIIEKTKVQMNKIVTDINNNANMCIELINNATKRTRTLMTESDQQIDDFKEAAQILRDLISKVEQLNKPSLTNNLIYMDSLGLGNTKSQTKKDEVKPTKEDTEKPISNKGGYKLKAYKSQQQSLFDQEIIENDNKSTQENKDTNEGDINLIPKIVTNIIPDNSSTSNLLDERVRKLYNSGFDVDEIAAKLSCSTSEVQFIIEMLN